MKNFNSYPPHKIDLLWDLIEEKLPPAAEDALMQEIRGDAALLNLLDDLLSFVEQGGNRELFDQTITDTGTLLMQTVVQDVDAQKEQRRKSNIFATALFILAAIFMIFHFNPRLLPAEHERIDAMAHTNNLRKPNRFHVDKTSGNFTHNSWLNEADRFFDLEATIQYDESLVLVAKTIACRYYSDMVELKPQLKVSGKTTIREIRKIALSPKVPEMLIASMKLSMNLPLAYASDDFHMEDWLASIEMELAPIDEEAIGDRPFNAPTAAGDPIWVPSHINAMNAMEGEGMPFPHYQDSELVQDGIIDLELFVNNSLRKTSARKKQSYGSVQACFDMAIIEQEMESLEIHWEIDDTIWDKTHTLADLEGQWFQIRFASDDSMKVLYKIDVSIEDIHENDDYPIEGMSNSFFGHAVSFDHLGQKEQRMNPIGRVAYLDEGHNAGASALFQLACVRPIDSATLTKRNSDGGHATKKICSNGTQLPMMIYQSTVISKE